MLQDDRRVIRLGVLLNKTEKQQLGDLARRLDQSEGAVIRVAVARYATDLAQDDLARLGEARVMFAEGKN